MESPLKPSEKELNHIFLYRKKTVLYRRIPLETKKQLMEEFAKNAYPNRIDYENMTKRISLSIHKIQNWFKYQRKNEFLSKKSALKNYRRKHKFEKTEKKLLEKSFRVNNSLDENTLTYLQQEIKCKEVHIKRWFYYRNQKLRSAKDKKESYMKESTNSTQSTVPSQHAKPDILDQSVQNQSIFMPEMLLNSKMYTMPNTMPNPMMAFPQNAFNNYAFLNRMYSRNAMNFNGLYNCPPFCAPNCFNQNNFSCLPNFQTVTPNNYGFFY